MSKSDYRKDRIEKVNQHLDEYYIDEDWFAGGSEDVQSIGQYRDQTPKVFALRFPWGTRPIAAGPYRSKPSNQPGVKLAAEFDLPYMVDCPIKDFGVPEPKIVEDALYATILMMRRGTVPYVGCFGGKGRTGLFLALMLKVSYKACRRFWHSKEIDYVAGIRNLYSDHAVETQEQADFVRDFDVRALVKAVKRIK